MSRIKLFISNIKMFVTPKIVTSMFNYIKRKIMAFTDIFKDNNEYDEKHIVGFLSFAVMVLFAAADITMGIIGRSLEVSDTIFTSFVVITLGSFGIAEAGKVFGPKK